MGVLYFTKPRASSRFPTEGQEFRFATKHPNVPKMHSTKRSLDEIPGTQLLPGQPRVIGTLWSVGGIGDKDLISTECFMLKKENTHTVTDVFGRPASPPIPKPAF